MASPMIYNEDVILDVDCTPPWWGHGMDCVRAATAALVDPEAELDIEYATEFTVGISRVMVRMLWPMQASSFDVAGWRTRIIARIEAQPGMQERRERWIERQNEKYGTPEEREARRLATLERIRAREAAPS